MNSPKRMFPIHVSALMLALILALSTSSVADTVVQSLTPSLSGSNNNVTKGGTYPIFSYAVNFGQFNSALGTLQSVVLDWNLVGNTTVSGNFKGSATVAFQNTTDTQGWNIFGGSTSVSSNLIGSEIFAPSAAYIGNGNVGFGNFTGNFVYSEGFFPAQFTGTGSGTITLTYMYDPPGTTTPAVPEPTSMLLLGSGLSFVATRFRKKSATK